MCIYSVMDIIFRMSPLDASVVSNKGILASLATSWTRIKNIEHIGHCLSVTTPHFICISGCNYIFLNRVTATMTRKRTSNKQLFCHQPPPPSRESHITLSSPKSDSHISHSGVRQTLSSWETNYSDSTETQGFFIFATKGDKIVSPPWLTSSCYPSVGEQNSKWTSSFRARTNMFLSSKCVVLKLVLLLY